MRRLVLFCSILFIVMGVYAQSGSLQTLTASPKHSSHSITPDSAKNKSGAENGLNRRAMRKKIMMTADTLTPSDYMMSIERVNDNLNSIGDSAKLNFEVNGMSRRVNDIMNDIKLIRLNIRDKHSVINIKNLYLYQSFVSNLDDENDRIKMHLFKLYNRVYHAKLHLKKALSDTIFRRVYADSTLRNKFDTRLVRLERKWNRTDSTTKANIDTLNAMKIKVADNSMSLSNMLNMFDTRLDKADRQLFGPEVNCLWQKPKTQAIVNDTSKRVISMLGSEQKAIGYYFSQTSGQRTFILILGILLFIWLFVKRKLLRTIRAQKESFNFLGLHFLNNHPVLSLFVLLLSLMPFFDAYAPTSYIAIEYILLLTAASIIFFKNQDSHFRFNWMALVILFVADVLTYLLVEPTLLTRLWMLALHVGIIIFAFRFYQKFDKKKAWYKWIKKAAIISMILAGLGIFCNLFGRFSLSGIFGLAAVFAITQAVILPIFIETFIEFILLQLQSSRMKKGVDKPFDCSFVIKKIKMPLIIVASILWLIMLTSNLNIYHSISNSVVDLLTSVRTIGSISFKLISVLMFFVIIWFAHILQRLVSFFFGETGSDTEDLVTVSKGQHSRLLITRLLVLIGGYLLAIAASGLPIDKLTFVLGALGVGIGMGLQNIVNNFVSGIILIFDGSLQIGDEIEVSGQAGKVKEIGLRASTLNTSDGAEVIIPNGNILSQNIVNWTFSNDQKRVMIWFSLSGKEMDANVINDVINNTIKEIAGVVAAKKPVILYTRVTPESCAITVRFWSTISNADNVKSQAMLQLSTAFSALDIDFQ
ncbi:MAG: mechanosensitive ion channel [Bacteroidota bacterium]|nr:mechanosensitive ion channel [Bacteroidota bacterium]